MNRPRGSTGGTFLAALVLALAACGTGATSSGPPVVSAPGPRPSASSVGDLADRVTRAAHAKGTVRITNGDDSSGGSVQRLRGSRVEFSMVAGGPGLGTIKMIYVGGIAYADLGQKHQGKSWVRVRLGGSSPKAVALSAVLTQTMTMGIGVGTDLAKAKELRLVGVERTVLEGRPVTRYSLIRSERETLALLQSLMPTPELRRQVRREAEGAHQEMDVWLDDDDLPARVDSRLVGGRRPQDTTSVVYSAWGAPVTIEPPPARDVAEVPV